MQKFGTKEVNVTEMEDDGNQIILDQSVVQIGFKGSILMQGGGMGDTGNFQEFLIRKSEKHVNDSHDQEIDLNISY